MQFGNKGNSLIDHLLSPLAMVEKITGVLVVCRYPGPPIHKVSYYCPPGFLARFSLTAIFYEILVLFWLALSKKPKYIAGYLLNPHGIIAFVIAKLTGKRVIQSLIAGPFELYSRKRPLGVNFDDPLPWFGNIFLKILNNSQAIITTGTFTRDFLLRHGVEESIIYPLINPPNKTRFKPLEISKTYDIVSVGRLVPVKHDEITIHVVSQLKEKFPSIKACIVGDGSSKRELMTLAQNLGLERNIDFVGYQKDTPRFYNSAKVFILTSEREGFPNVFLEAMACALPCVVSSCGDITDVAENGRNSFVIQNFNDVSGFVRAISQLLENTELYSLLSRNALDTIESISAEEVTDKWNSILEKTQSGVK